MENITAISLLSLGILLCAAEVFIPGFILFPMGVGAIGASIASFLGIPLPWSILIWSVTSLAFWLRMKKMLHGNPQDDYKSGADALIGKEALVSETIRPKHSDGRVKIYGDEWQVIWIGDQVETPVGEKVLVTGTEGNKSICNNNS